MSLSDRFRSWVASPEFAVTATAVVVAVATLLVTAVLFPDSDAPLFALFAVGLGVPSTYGNPWTPHYECRRPAVAWSAVASVLVAVAYVALFLVLGEFAPEQAGVGAFVLTWALAIGGSVVAGRRGVGEPSDATGQQ